MIAGINIVTIAGVFLLLYAAWSDFRLWKIPNGVVLALIVVYALGATLRLMEAKEAGGALGLLMEQDLGATLFSFAGIGGDLAAGLLLFALGFTLWCFRLFGAGDAKLFLPIGLFVGWYGMLPFSIFLLIGGVLTMLALKLPMPLQFAHYAVIMRLQEIRATRKIPYGVIMVAAALAVMALPPALA
ncbi:prepilin peptidase [Sinorhizobium alkalisoli]|uniref:Pilus assembly protein CpaA n=1 Tax=Sinorhizobium alkalisoli TaxID=1752398 RepID=A0A1E3VA34_9HYPH|nr:prepilin peptidase [Sinorhizobium alkalisoli]MCG5481021.1 prepilin peptidase [Sinorhizobium alkalisoli]ODR90419.1 pilus assembly protein CpaA [Sinorhizobium alkalisoli]